PQPDTAAPVPAGGFALFLGVALSITAIPVLARIMMELHITRTRLGAITITAAAVDDAVGWPLRATVAAVVGTGLEPDAGAAQLRDFVTGFLLPIFFTSTGLRTDVGSLGTPAMGLWAAAVFAAAVLGKFGGCGLAARLGGLSRRESACVGAMMNTRGLMALVV